MTKKKETPGQAATAADKVKDLERQLSQLREENSKLKKDNSNLIGLSKEIEENYNYISKEYNLLLKTSGETEGRLQKEIEGYKEDLSHVVEKDEEYQELQKTVEDLQRERDSFYCEAENEAELKNEAYAFILSHGLLDMFIGYFHGREWEPIHETVDYLVRQTNPKGCWLEKKER